MNKSSKKTNPFLQLLGSAAKGATACLAALFVLCLLDNISKRLQNKDKERIINYSSKNQE